MSNDLVINAYKEQIKESILKMQAVKLAGFDIIIEQLKLRGIDCTRVIQFLNKIKDSSTKEQLDNITIDEMNEIIEDINSQVTKSLISQVEIAAILERESKKIAIEKSPNGKINDNDKYVKVGANLSSEVSKHGISHGLSICIKNYFIQRMYQTKYKEKVEEQEQKIGIYNENEIIEKKENKTTSIDNSQKRLLMKEIFDKEIKIDEKVEFTISKNEYFKYLSNLIGRLNDYK